ncbi:MAG: alpha/beta hydrolase [Terriglobia bacterium]
MDAMDLTANFLDVRSLWGGGQVADAVQLKQWTGSSNYADHARYVDLSSQDFENYIHGKDALIATHGFNVNREQGIECLTYWNTLLGSVPLPGAPAPLPAKFPGAFIGFLLPGDSEFWHALSYPVEPQHATDSGNMLAEFVDNHFGEATSVSFVSHSLGARVILQAISQMKMPARRAIVMAGAVSDRCLSGEFAAVPSKVEVISALASKKDEVLRWAFPMGDLSAEIIDHDHPWWESALGRFGPAPSPQRYQPPCQIPEGWDYGHGNYLQTQPPAPALLPPPTNVPKSGPPPLGGVPGWQEAFSASFVSTRFR